MGQDDGRQEARPRADGPPHPRRQLLPAFQEHPPVDRVLRPARPLGHEPHPRLRGPQPRSPPQGSLSATTLPAEHGAGPEVRPAGAARRRRHRQRRLPARRLRRGDHLPRRQPSAVPRRRAAVYRGGAQEVRRPAQGEQGRGQRRHHRELHDAAARGQPVPGGCRGVRHLRQLADRPAAHPRHLPGPAQGAGRRPRFPVHADHLPLRRQGRGRLRLPVRRLHPSAGRPGQQDQGEATPRSADEHVHADGGRPVPRLAVRQAARRL